MKINILNVIIASFLTQSCLTSCEEKTENNLLITYSEEISTEVPIKPRQLHYDEITADDQPELNPGNYGHIKFDDEPPGPRIQPLHLDTTNTNKPLTGLNKPGGNSDIDSIVFDRDQNGDLTPDQFEVEESNHKVYDEYLSEIYYNDGSNDSDDLKHENDTGKTLLNYNNETFYQYGDTDDLKSTNEAKKESKKIKGRIAFREDSKVENNQEPVRKKTRRGRRKPRVQALSPGIGPIANISPVPSYNDISYANSGYSTYPGPIEPNSGFPIPYADAYPGNPTKYAVSPYPTVVYPGLPSNRPGYPGYTPYPSAQGSESQTRPANHDTQIDTEYPPHKSPGSNLNGQQANTRPGTYTRPGQNSAGGYSGYPAQPSYPGYVSNRDPTEQQYRPYQGHLGFYRPQPPKSLTQRVAEALTSIARYDDKRCVPRLLCEVASGSTISSPTLLKATAGLGPLLTILQSYNGESSSPLFLFGRAAFLGMTAKGNPTSCRYAYPQCPNDPDGLIKYLNNHNGGFFRFFGEPKRENQQQNLEQFYGHLSGQNGYQTSQQQQQNYGYSYNYPYGSKPQINRPSHYREQNTFRNAKETDTEVAQSIIEERIQNKQIPDADEDIEEDIKNPSSKWTFPDQVSNSIRDERPIRKRRERAKKHGAPEIPFKGKRGGDPLKFPDEKGPIDQSYVDREIDYIRKQKGTFFPSQNNFYFQTSYQTDTPENLGEYVFDYKHNFYVKRPKAVNDNTETVYIVRGNGDPNHPEIVKLRPGQTI